SEPMQQTYFADCGGCYRFRAQTQQCSCFFRGCVTRLEFRLCPWVCRSVGILCPYSHLRPLYLDDFKNHLRVTRVKSSRVLLCAHSNDASKCPVGGPAVAGTGPGRQVSNHRSSGLADADGRSGCRFGTFIGCVTTGSPDSRDEKPRYVCPATG